MNAEGSGGSESVLDANGLRELVAALVSRGYRVIGPVLRDSAIELAELTTADELPYGWGVDTAPGHYRLRRRDDGACFGHSAGPQSWKQFLHPPRQRVWAGAVDGTTDPEPEEPLPYAFLGVRGCDLAAIAKLDRVCWVPARIRTRRSPVTANGSSWSPSTAQSPAPCVSARPWAPDRPRVPDTTVAAEDR